MVLLTGVGVPAVRLGPGETGPEGAGKLRERMLTPIEERMLVLLLWLSASLPGRRSVGGSVVGLGMRAAWG
jgi:hypothetical protein